MNGERPFTAQVDCPREFVRELAELINQWGFDAQANIAMAAFTGSVYRRDELLGRSEPNGVVRLGP